MAEAGLPKRRGSVLRALASTASWPLRVAMRSMKAPPWPLSVTPATPPAAAVARSCSKVMLCIGSIALEMEALCAVDRRRATTAG
jgi:hypothetical protein